MKINLDNKYLVLQGWYDKILTLKEIIWDKKAIIYFYPKDNTPGCTLENKDFSCMKNDFEKLGYKLIWVSKDSLESHKKFVSNHSLEIDLISDSDLNLHKELLAYWEKNNYWKIVMWVIRSTFVVDNSWEVLKEYRNIRATWHAERILKELSN